MGQFCYCSLSPQGDDNHMPRYICSTFPIAAYPRKGTITWTSSSRRRRKSLIAAYPRKGTITRRGLVCTDNHAIAAYPRKGTITQDEQSNQEHFDCSLSPQGDDNSVPLSLLTVVWNCSLSPQGDDNLLMLIFFIIISYCSLSPQGGKKLRIKRCGVFLLQTLTFCFPWAVPL